MTRRKVKLAFIVNNSSRKTTYKKGRGACSKKRMRYPLYVGLMPGLSFTVPTILPLWCGPPLRNLPEIDLHNNMVNHQEFVQKRITKADQLLLKKKDNREVNLTEDMYRFLQIGQLTIPARDLNDLGYLVDQYLNSLNRRI
ncbi:Agamous-like MADS-box protein AGL80 [Raphanus sativus]|nr:Agamous-like MADS-box protein AGL80 [Raphanus sativus]